MQLHIMHNKEVNYELYVYDMIIVYGVKGIDFLYLIYK